MKGVLTALAAVMIIMLCSVGVSATSGAEQADLYEASGAAELEKSLPDETVEVLERLQISYDITEEGTSVEAVIDEVIGWVRDSLTAPMAAVSAMMAVILLTAAHSAAELPLARSRVTMNFAAAVSLCLICTVPLCSVVQQAAEAVRSCGVFMLAVVPVFAAVIATAGFAATAGTFSTLTFGAAQVVVQLADRLLIPLCRVMLCCSAVGGIGEVNLSGIVSAVKKGANWLLGGLMTLFLGLLGLQTSITGASDSVGLRTAKYVVGSFVPVVGTSIGEALSAVSGSLSLLKTGIGVYAVAALAVMILPPIIKSLLWRVVLEVAAGCCDIFDLSQQGTLLRSVSGALGIMMAVLLCCGVMFIVSTAIAAAATGKAV